MGAKQTKMHSFKPEKEDPIGTFSLVPINIIHNQGFYCYIHVPLDEYDHRKINNFRIYYLVDNMQRLKSKFASLVHMRLDTWNIFPAFIR